MSSSDEVQRSWISKFCGRRGNEFFCIVDKAFIQETFNLFGLDSKVHFFLTARSIILDVNPEYNSDTLHYKKAIEESANALYGLIHARYIMTDAGIHKMALKYRHNRFGSCPRLYCERQKTLPVGLSDIKGEYCVKMYCPKCNDVFFPKRSRYRKVDGAFFGTGFPHLFFMLHPEFRPEPATERYIPMLNGLPITYKPYQETSDPEVKEADVEASEGDLEVAPEDPLEDVPEDAFEVTSENVSGGVSKSVFEVAHEDAHEGAQEGAFEVATSGVSEGALESALGLASEDLPDLTNDLIRLFHNIVI